MGQGWGHLGLSTRSVVGEQVASWWDLGLYPSKQGCAGGHFLGLQVPGALQSWKGKKEKKREVGALPRTCPPHPTHLTGGTCGEGDAGWRGEVGAPKATHGGCIVGVELEAV